MTGLPLPKKYCILTEQSLTVSGLAIVRNSVKPCPTFPSAKYQVLLLRPDPEGGIGVGVIVDVGEDVGEGLGVFVAVGEAVGEDLGVFVAVGEAVSVLRAAELAWTASIGKVKIARIMAISATNPANAIQ
jgi:hypothetical protein